MSISTSFKLIPFSSALDIIRDLEPNNIGLQIAFVAKFYAATIVSLSHPSAKAIIFLFFSIPIFFSTYFK